MTHDDAVKRLSKIESNEPALRQIYLEYLNRYEQHIQPIAKQADQYWSEQCEKRELEHFLQANPRPNAEKLAASLEPIPSKPGQSKPNKRAVQSTSSLPTGLLSPSMRAFLKLTKAEQEAIMKGVK